MKYKIGDKVRIVSKRTQRYWNHEMDKYLGKTMTVTASGRNSRGETYYRVFEDRTSEGIWWYWYEDMISGLADPEREPCTVELRFDGMITTATLKRGGRDVKTAEARCNPKDTYSRAEGAKVAVERLFEKKRKEEQERFEAAVAEAVRKELQKQQSRQEEQVADCHRAVIHNDFMELLSNDTNLKSVIPDDGELY